MFQLQFVQSENVSEKSGTKYKKKKISLSVCLRCDIRCQFKQLSDLWESPMKHECLLVAICGVATKTLTET